MRVQRPSAFKVDQKYWHLYAHSVMVVHVCFKHRTTRKGFGHCPLCREPMIKTWKGFRTGKKKDDKHWIESERIITTRDERIKRKQMMKEFGNG